ncbi:MAG: tetratricopeptide repeat protein, partial [candidate division Zixibacteria bacterium]|nr:tetratricopeptide repeat protein [candidate division Zixibacteria bacterium]
ELSKIYQSQGKLAEAEEVLLESLEIDNKQLHPRTELSKIYQSQGKLEEAEKVLLDLLKMEKDSCHGMAELITIYSSLSNPQKCFDVFDEFLKSVKLRGKVRRHQAMFNNIFRLCHKFNYKKKASLYYNTHTRHLDDRNITLFVSLFGKWFGMQ